MAAIEVIKGAPPHPLTRIRAAVIWARAEGIVVRPGPFGVVCVAPMAAVRWAMDANARFVDPFGAAILHAQPLATTLFAAAAEATNAPEAWIIGFQAGFEGTNLMRSWSKVVYSRLALAGFEAGVIYRRDFRRLFPADGGVQ